jgi:hypothetical protein
MMDKPKNKFSVFKKIEKEMGLGIVELALFLILALVVGSLFVGIMTGGIETSSRHYDRIEFQVLQCLDSDYADVCIRSVFEGVRK